MLAELTAEGGVTWTKLSSSTAEELAAVAREAKLEPVDAEFIVHDRHRPEVGVRENYLIILVHIPTFEKQARVTRGVPLYFIITEDKLWTVHHRPIVVLSKLFEEYERSAEKREEYFADGPLGLALHIISSMYGSAFDKLERLNKHIAIAEDAIFQGNERKMVEEISILRRDVMDFRKIIRPQTSLFATLPDHSLMTSDTTSDWRRLHSQTQKLWDLLESLSESAGELAHTNASLLQHKENEILRLITYYSTVTIPALVIVYQVNPFSGTAPFWQLVLFWGALGILAATLAAILLRARSKRVL